MKKIKEFNKTSLTQFRAEMAAVFAKFEKSSGVEVSMDSVRYSSNTLSFNAKAKLVGTKSAEAQALEMLTKFKENDVIRIGKLGEVKLVGYKTKNRRYPFIVETVHTGKRYKLSDSQVEARVNVI